MPDKTASLVFFYFGESSYVNRLAQETVPLHKALTGYDKSILLRHETDVGAIELSEPAEKAADVLNVPTKANLVRHLNELGAAGYVVDLFIFSHGSVDKFLVSRGSYGNNATINRAYLEANVDPLKLRIVWQCNCWGSSLNGTWRSLGAQATAGSRYVNFYPTRFTGFIKRWNRGEKFGKSLTESDTKAVHTPVQAYMLLDAALRADEWDGNAWQALKVLGDNEHSRRYFRECWLGDDTALAGATSLTGKQIMNDSSHMVVAGRRKITKTSKLTWKL